MRVMMYIALIQIKSSRHLSVKLSLSGFKLLWSMHKQTTNPFFMHFIHSNLADMRFLKFSLKSRHKTIQTPPESPQPTHELDNTIGCDFRASLLEDIMRELHSSNYQKVPTKEEGHSVPRLDIRERVSCLCITREWRRGSVITPSQRYSCYHYSFFTLITDHKLIK
ncbi:hypothetical protein BC941DRAFT_502082 [Chlamydoabsidia padenii]|nr:hypothetical protein BC941DRAFT_502082 [Chlamydoabsidia padenii]